MATREGIIMDRRVGIIQISNYMLIDEPDRILRAFRDLLVYQVVPSDFYGRRDYYCYSPEFREVSDGERIPKYQLTIDRDGNVTEMKEEEF